MDNRIVIGDRELTLVFDTAAFVDLETAFGSIDRMYKRFDEDILPMTTGLMLAAICATSGTCDRDKKQKIEFSWLVKNATPVEAQKLGLMARTAVIKGMTTTEKLFDEEQAVDVGLEEDAAKKTRADA
jgi:hypothetical protein